MSDANIGHNKTEIDILSRRGMLKNIIRFSTPIMLTGVLQLLFNDCDIIVCRYFGSGNAVGAISSTDALINLIVMLFMGMSVGANILMAKCVGANNKEQGQKVVYTSTMIAAVVGLAVGIIGTLFSGIFLKWMGTNSELLDLSRQYLAIYFLGIPFTMLFNFGAALLRAVGNTRTPFLFLTFSGVINVLLNLLFVVGFRLDITGVAIASAISQFLAAAMIFYYLRFKYNGFFIFRFRQFHFSSAEARQIIKIGLPVGIQSVIFSIANVMIQVGVNDLSRTLGSAVVNGNGGAAALESFIDVALNSCAQAVITFGAANYGAKNKKNIKLVILWTIFLVMCVWAVVGTAALLLRIPLLNLYVSTDEALFYGSQRMLIVVSAYVLCGLMDIFAYSLRAMGHSLLPTIISISGVCGTRLLFFFCIFPIDRFHSLEWLSASYPLSWGLTAMTHVVFFMVFYKKLRFIEQSKIA